MPGSDIKILSTRLMDQACIDRAAMHGIEIAHVPFIRVDMVADTAIDTRIAALAAENILAIFTSINAVNTVIRKLGKKPAWTIACISGRTATAAMEFFGREQIKITGTDGRALAENIIIQIPVLPVVFFCGNLRMDYLPAELAANNIATEEIIVYHTTPAPVKVKDLYDGIVFFSPSAADSFFRLNAVAAHVVLFAIGSTTANHLKKYTSNPVLYSERPSQLSITESIIDYYDQKRSFA